MAFGLIGFSGIIIDFYCRQILTSFSSLLKKENLYNKLVLTIILLGQNDCFSQVINQSAIYRQVNCDKLLRIHYDNDILNTSDEYYTQGVNLELVHPVLKHNPLNYLLLSPVNHKSTYVLCLEHNIFTPSDIQNPQIALNDRPYASCLMLKSIICAAQKEKDVLLVSTLTTGIIGHLANGDCMQIYTHKFGSNIRPNGWDYQVKNALILNYQVNYDRKILEYNKGFVLHASGEIRLGTMHDMIGAGLVIIAGQRNTPFAVNKKRILMKSRRLKADDFYLYSDTYLRFVGYDASLQGGVFNKQNPYVLADNRIERLILGNNSGVVFTVKNLYFEYYYTFQSKEFKTAILHSWGGFKIGFGF